MTNHSDVLVIGGGFAGVACARRLERLLPAARSITLLNDENYFVFQPLLPEVVGASLAPSHVVSPLRHLLRRTRIVRGEACSLSRPANSGEPGTVLVACAGIDAPIALTADHIVLALGSIVDVQRIPGMAEHSLPMRNVADALALRHTIIERLERAVIEPDERERAALTKFVVVGGGFSGVETAAEINDLIRGVARYYPSLPRSSLRVVCVHARDHVLPELDRPLGEHARAVLERRGVEFRLEARTQAASRDGVHLADGSVITARTIVCTIGVAPHPLIKDFAGNGNGRLATDEFLRVPGHTHLWAIGDCAQNPDGHGGTCPPTAQFASRLGDRAGRNIAAAMLGRQSRPFRHRSQGQLATLGHRRAVAQIGKLRITGFLAWWLWRTIYLLKLPRFDRKLRVVIDWTLSLFFPRDLTALPLRARERRSAIHLEKGETLFRQGDPSAAFYVVESGRIELTRVDESGHELGRDLLGPGEHFGEGSLLHGRRRTTTARAVEPSNVMAFPAREFAELTSRFAGLRRLFEATSRRFQPAESIVPAWVPAERLTLPVADIMTRAPLTVAPTTTLGQCLGLLVERGFHSFPLVDAEQRLVGIVTGTDLFAALRRDVDLQEPVTTIASASVLCVASDAPIRAAVEVMRRRDMKHVVVLDADRKVTGIVSLKDVLRHLVVPARATDPVVPT